MSKKSRRRRGQDREGFQQSPAALASPLRPNDQTPSSAIINHLLLPPMPKHPLLIASLGNVGRAYLNSRHNAGHIFLSALVSHLSYPPFSRSVQHGLGQISQGQDALLWQSPTLMNVSGPAVAVAWRRFKRDLDIESQGQARLVIVHDELESPLGKVKLKKGGSVKGHNGLKSCKQSLNGEDFWRLGIGIGRPVSRESDDVAAYVLSAMSGQDKEKLLSGIEEAVEELGKLSEGK